MTMTLLPVIYLQLTALWISGSMGSRRKEILWDRSNLDKCHFVLDYCSDKGSRHVLVGCKNYNWGLCRYRCPLGHPLLPGGGQRCGAVCPYGYFAGLYAEVADVCRLHSRTCPEGQHVILPGTSWHDTICGNPEDYVLPRGLLKTIESDVFLTTLDTLTTTWVRAISEEDNKKLCYFLSRPNQEMCKYTFEHLLNLLPGIVGMAPEDLYDMLNRVSSFKTANLMFSTVVKPFLDRQDLEHRQDLEPKLSIQFMHPNPWWVGEQDTLVIQTRVTIPMGMEHRYIPYTLKWYTGKLGDRLVVEANTSDIVSSELRYNITRGLDWNKGESFGFFVYILDISLVVENFHYGLFDSVEVGIEVYDKYDEVTVGLFKDLDVNCIWKPKLHPACNCTRALLNYINPDGLCSPTCISTPFAHLSKGVEGSNNDWTLEITHEDPDTSIMGQGRVLYGTVPPKTERFCLVTMDVFTLSPGPTLNAPSAPLDVRRCDVVLVEFDIWLEELPYGFDAQYLHIPVRSLLNEDKTPELYIPLAANDTLQTIIRQGWGGKIGVKLSFLHSTRGVPRQEEIAAVLDWILTFHSHQNRAPRVVVIDVNIGTVKSSDFDMMNTLYGSKLELIPGLSAGAIADVIQARGYPPDHGRQWHNRTTHHSLTPEQAQAEVVLRELGLFVSSHGAFLNLDTVSVFPQSKPGCERVKPSRWSVGEYKPEDPYGIRIPRDERYPERSGVMVFEELCKRSNNRAGIVVSVPSADYVTGGRCTLLRLLNRHVKTDPGGSDDKRVHYSMRDLTGIISDMAKWGVCRYSLGYLDYTFVNSEGVPTFTELSRIISLAATKTRTLHYRYTRNSNFGDGGYSYARVDGVYKLEGGMFFQRVTDGIPLTKSFVPVPEMPNLRLGLSSDMNVGAPLPVSELITRDTIETVKFIPYGAQVINLNYKDRVAFVDQDRICIHSPSTIVRSDGLRLPSFGQSEEDESHPKGCYSYISRAEHRARVSVRLPITRESRESVLQSILDSSRWLGAPVLTREEEDWLSSKAVMKTSTTLPSLQGSLSIDSMHLISKTVECIRGSSSCMELGDYADNNWPQGGTGYPIAILSVVESDDEILVKMIIHVNHGAIRVKIPCDLKPFSLGSEQPSSPQPMPGYYMHTEEPLISKLKDYVTNVGPLTAWIVQPLALLYCPDMDQSLADHLPSSEMYFQKTYDCVSVMNESLGDLRDVFSQLGSLIERNEKTVELTVKRLTYMLARTSALCLSATVLAVLINITVIAMLCSMCKGSRYSEQRYRKLQ